jgi:hypothetical protein
MAAQNQHFQFWRLKIRSFSFGGSKSALSVLYLNGGSKSALSVLAALNPLFQFWRL